MKRFFVNFPQNVPKLSLFVMQYDNWYTLESIRYPIDNKTKLNIIAIICNHLQSFFVDFRSNVPDCHRLSV